MKTINTFQNKAEYEKARSMHDANYNAVKEYCRVNKTNGIPVEISKTFPFADEITNELRSKIEVWEFMHEKPLQYFLYISEDEKEANTWKGDFLGNIHFGREYRSNMGDKRQPVDVFGINGIKYYGIYFKSSGNYARIKAYKNQN